MKGRKGKEERERGARARTQMKKDRVETPDHRRCLLGVERNKVGKTWWSKGKKGLTKVRAESLI